MSSQVEAASRVSKRPMSLMKSKIERLGDTHNGATIKSVVGYEFTYWVHRCTASTGLRRKNGYHLSFKIQHLFIKAKPLNSASIQKTVQVIFLLVFVQRLMKCIKSGH